MKTVFTLFGLVVLLIWDTTQNDSDFLRFGVESVVRFFKTVGF